MPGWATSAPSSPRWEASARSRRPGLSSAPGSSSRTTGPETRATWRRAPSSSASSWTTSSRGLTGRQRPFVADGEDHWFGPARFFSAIRGRHGRRLYGSFPSGHSAAAFALATVVALQYRHRAWVPVMAYTIAAGVGLSRMTMDQHWASDVVVGAVIGHLVARLVVNNHARRQSPRPDARLFRRGLALSVFWDLDPAGR